METVSRGQVGSSEFALPARVQEALGLLVGSAKEGLLALSVGVGLGVLAELMEEEVVEVVGVRGKHDPDLVTVLRALGYRARLVSLPFETFFKQINDPRYRWQLSGSGWNADYPAASNFFAPLTCTSFKPGSTANNNPGGFCDRHIDDEISQAVSLQASNPQAAARLWAKIDRDTTNRAPWLASDNARHMDFVSSRVGNYVFSPTNNGPLLDQLWVR